MLRYFKENKHWIFSGIGVFAIGLLITILAAIWKNSSPPITLEVGKGAANASRRDPAPSFEMPGPARDSTPTEARPSAQPPPVMQAPGEPHADNTAPAE